MVHKIREPFTIVVATGIGIGLGLGGFDLEMT